jgi:hypothetical protein
LEQDFLFEQTTIPYLKDMDSASVMKSSSSDFKQMEFPDRIENTAEGLLISWIRYRINEVFNSIKLRGTRFIIDNEDLTLPNPVEPLF